MVWKNGVNWNFLLLQLAIMKNVQITIDNIVRLQTQVIHAYFYWYVFVVLGFGSLFRTRSKSMKLLFSVEKKIIDFRMSL